MRNRKYLLFLPFLMIVNLVPAQEVETEEEGKKQRDWTLNGYLKDMVSYTRPNSPFLPEHLIDNLIHNRLFFKWYMHRNLNFTAEMRNRIMFGDQVRINPFFANNLRGSDDYLKMSYTYEDSGRVVGHFILDRLYFRYTSGKFEATAGRQRINWGINFAWNPNDIFNAFSYFDFDYEERPGSDAILLKYYTGIVSSIEIAGRISDNIDNFTGALMWKTNFKKYDIQAMSGITNRNFVVGGGWAGNLLKAGFKGEGSYFLPMEEATDTAEVLNMTISLDYSFKNSLYILGSILYNSDGKVRPNQFDQISYYSGVISAKQLSPYRYSGLINASYQFHPLVAGGISLIGYPGNTDIFLGPQLSISVLQNLDLNLFAQIVLGDDFSGYNVTTQAYYLRLKYSF